MRDLLSRTLSKLSNQLFQWSKQLEIWSYMVENPPKVSTKATDDREFPSFDFKRLR